MRTAALGIALARKWWLVAFGLVIFWMVGCFDLQAQTPYVAPTPPPLQTAADNAAALQQMVDVTAAYTWLTGYIVNHDSQLNTLAQTLQNQDALILALQQQVAALQAQVAALTPTPPVITPPPSCTSPCVPIQAVSQSVVVGSTATFTITETGFTQVSWQSFPPGGTWGSIPGQSTINVSGTTMVSYITPPVTAAMNGTQYRLYMAPTATGSYTYSQPATLTVTAQ